jgi:hypothetical protein
MKRKFNLSESHPLIIAFVGVVIIAMGCQFGRFLLHTL